MTLTFRVRSKGQFFYVWKRFYRIKISDDLTVEIIFAYVIQVIDLIYPQNTNSLISHRLLHFNWHQRVREAGPMIAVVQPLSWRSLSARGEVVELTRHR